MLRTLKRNFKHTMGKLITTPPGVPMSDEELKFLISNYIAGWGDSLQVFGTIEQLEKFVVETKEIFTDGWMPDETWRW